MNCHFYFFCDWNENWGKKTDVSVLLRMMSLYCIWQFKDYICASLCKLQRREQPAIIYSSFNTIFFKQSKDKTWKITMNIQVIILISNMTAFWNSIPQIMSLSDVKMGIDSSLWKSIHEQTKRLIIMLFNVKLPIILTFIHPATMLKWAHSGQLWVNCGALWQGIPTLIRCGLHVGVPTQSSQQFSMGKPTVGLATENQCRTQNSFALLVSWSPQSSWAACSQICFSPCLSLFCVCVPVYGQDPLWVPASGWTHLQLSTTCTARSSHQEDHCIRWRVRLIFKLCNFRCN